MHAGPFLRRLQASRSYGFVLLLVLTTFAFVAAAPDEQWARRACGSILSPAADGGIIRMGRVSVFTPTGR